MSSRFVATTILLFNCLFLTLLDSSQLTVLMTIGGAPVASNQKIDILNPQNSSLIATAKTNAWGVASFNLLDSPSSGIVKTAINGRTHLLPANFTEWPAFVELSLPAPTTVTLIDPNASPGQRSVVALNSLGVAVGYSRITAINGVASFHLEAGEYIFRHSVNGRIFYSEPVPAGAQTLIQIPPATTISVMDGSVLAIGMSVSAYTTDGNAIGYSRTTNSEGYATFHVAEDIIQFRVSKNGRHFFSPVVARGEQASIEIPVPTEVRLNLPDGLNPTSFSVAAFTYPGVAIGYSRTANESSVATFHLSTGTYRFRVTHNGREFFSEPVLNGETAEINLHSYTSVQVLHGSQPLSGISVTSLGSSLEVFGYSRATDSNGIAKFSLPEGDWIFRISRLGVHHFSNSTPMGGQTTIAMPLDSRVQLSGLESLQGVGISLVDSQNQPLGYSRSTDSEGLASFSITTTALVKFRVSHNGRHFFSDEFYAPSDEYIQIPAPTTVALIVPDEVNPGGISVAAWNASTAIGYSRTANSEGVAKFSLLDGQYRFRVSHNGRQFFSETVLAGTSTIIDMTPYTKVHVTLASEPWEGVTVQSFDGTENAKYSRKTDPEGEARFSVPEGDWRFRVSRHGVSHFSESVARGEVTSISVPLDTELIVHGIDAPQGVAVTLVNQEHQSLGYSRKLDSEGIARFSITTEEAVKFRVNYNGRQFYSEPIYASGTTVINIFEPTTVLLTGENGPISSGKIDAYDADGIAVKYSRNTDASGVAKFHLPAGGYKFRHVINGRNFLSNVGISSTTFTLTVPPAIQVRVMRNDQPVGSNYIVQPVNMNLQPSGLMSLTDVDSKALVYLPDGQWRFRVSDLGHTYYSNDVTVNSTSSAAVVQLSSPMGELNLSWASYPDEVLSKIVYGSDSDLTHTIDWSNQTDSTISIGCLSDTLNISMTYSFGTHVSTVACPGRNNFSSMKRTVVVTFPGAIPDQGEAQICLDSSESDTQCWDSNSGFEAYLIPASYSAYLVTSNATIPFDNLIEVNTENELILAAPYMHRILIVRGGVPIKNLAVLAPTTVLPPSGWASGTSGTVLLSRMVTYPAVLTIEDDSLQLNSGDASRVWHLSEQIPVSNPVSPLNTSVSGFSTQYVLEPDTILLKVFGEPEAVVRPSPNTYAVGLLGPMGPRGVSLSLESSEPFNATVQLRAFDDQNPFVLGDVVFSQPFFVPQGSSSHQIFPLLQGGGESRWVAPGNYKLLITPTNSSLSIFAVFVDSLGNESRGNHGQNILLGY